MRNGMDIGLKMWNRVDMGLKCGMERIMEIMNYY